MRQFLFRRHLRVVLSMTIFRVVVTGRASRRTERNAVPASMD
jgi:hypothetical protein